MIAVFSGTIVNWIKGGVKALQVFANAMKGLKAIRALMDGARGVMNAFKKIGRLFKAMGSKIGGTLGKMFDNVMEFFKGIFKWGDEAPAGAVDDVHTPGSKNKPDGSGGPKNDGPDRKKNKYNEGDGKDWLRDIAYADALREITSSNIEGEPIPVFELDLKKVKQRHPIVKRFIIEKAGDAGEFVYMQASRKRLLGFKYNPKVKFKQNYKKVSGYEKGKLGTSTTNNYKSTFFKKFPKTEGDVWVHHAIEQNALKKYPKLISESQMHSIENLRGIPKDINPDIHLSKIRMEWNEFYIDNPNPTLQNLLDKVTDIDNKFGHLFDPPIR